MKKFIAIIVVLLVVAVNVVMLLPKPSAQTETKECSAVKWPKIELSEVNPGIIPNLLKS